MKKKCGKIIILILSIIVIVTIPGRVFAQSDDRLSFVYGTNHFEGAIYTSSFIPPSVNSVYLLADKTNILASRYTDVYYWPITNEYKADWDEANIIVEGELEILKSGDIIDTLQLTEYVIQYDGLDRIDTTRLYLGEAAVSAYKNFEQQQKKYREDLYNYHLALNTYREEFQKSLGDLQAGIISEDELPIPPEPLQDLTLFSTQLLWGFPINLPSGNYQIRLRNENDEIVPDSVKDLVIFEPISEGVGYKILSEDRWTNPTASHDINEIIYSVDEQVFYLEPYQQKQYNQQYYTRMNNPQDTVSRSDRTLWVSHKPIDDVSLNLHRRSGIQNIEIEDFYVRQLAGSRLGYEIIEFDPLLSSEPSFSAFKIDLSKEYDIFAIELVQSNNRAIDRSYRQVRILLSRQNWIIYLIGSLPLLIGVFVHFWRRSRIRDVKVLGTG